ncbi:MAG: molybdopterin-dependent oxidoreductase, partial [Thaumarchaeota archaeon]|nr:molybdopterin-dependent oxidoreductase [Nitrososphaerota archaeon]
NVTVALGSVPQGQGHETIATSLVSEILGVSPNNVTVFTGFDSTRNIGTPTSGTYSSRFAPICSNAIVLAAREIRSKLLRIASKILNAKPDELKIDNGQICKVSNSSVAVSLKDLAGFVYSGMLDRNPVEERSLDSTVTYSYPFGRNNEEAMRNLASSYAYQAHAVVVEVDLETGKVKLLRYAVVDDSGRSLNKMIVEGQVHGGTYNGIAAALFEKFVYDDEGQLISSTFNDYLAPTALDIPALKVELLETPSPFTPTGAKGVGESGALGPQPAIINAIEDSLRPYGIKILESHVTPEMIVNLIHHVAAPEAFLS